MTDLLDSENLPVVNYVSLERWQVSSAVPLNSADEHGENDSNLQPHQSQTQLSANLPFQFRWDINSKVVLWCGDLSALDTDAIVNSTSESLRDRSSAFCDRVLRRAGNELQNEIKREIRVCKTGDAKLTKGYRLPARYVIHTVGPKFNEKYKTAAQSALHSCYRNVLKVARENEIRTLSICCIHSARRGYPEDQGAHIALRTVRRFLEHYTDFMEVIVFVVTPLEESVYNSIMPMYFPRSKEEELWSAINLPNDIGNEFGEPVIEDRVIRISAKPATRLGISNPFARRQEESASTAYAGDTDEDGVNMAGSDGEEGMIEEDLDAAVGKLSFAQMAADPDKRHAAAARGNAEEGGVDPVTDALDKRYERAIRIAQGENLHQIESLNCIYQSGFDKRGRIVIVFLAKKFFPHDIDLKKAVLYLLKFLDPIATRKQFILVYVHSQTERRNRIPVSVLEEIYNLVDFKYRRNFRALYMLHPSLLSKFSIWWFTSTSGRSGLKEKVQQISSLQEMFHKISPDQLDLPQYVIDHDKKVNASRYAASAPPTDDTPTVVSATSNFAL